MLFNDEIMMEAELEDFEDVQFCVERMSQNKM